MTLRWQPFLLFILLTIVPAGTAIIFLSQEQEERQADWQRTNLDRLQNRLLQLGFRAHPKVQVSEGIRRLATQVGQQGYRPVVDNPLPVCFPAGYPVQVAVFTPEGDFWAPDWAPVGSRFLWKQFWQDLCRNDIPGQNLERYKKIFGTWLTRDVARYSSITLEVSTPGGEGFFSFQRFTGLAGLIVFVSATPSPLARWQELIAREPVRDCSIWVREPRSGLVAGTRPPGAAERAMLDRAVRNTGAPEVVGDVFSASQRTEEDLVILGRMRVRAPARGFPLHRILLLVAFLGPGWWVVAGGNPLSRLGIHGRLLVLFCLCAFLPVVLLLHLGWKNLRESGRRAEEEVHERNLDRLRVADTAFREAQRNQDRVFRRVTERVGKIARQDFSAGARYLEAARCRGDLLGYVLFDQGGRERASWWVAPQIRDLANLFAREMSRRYRDDRFPVPDDSVGWDFFQFLQSPMVGFDAISDSPGVGRMLGIGGATVFWYWDIFRVGNASDPGFVGLVQATGKVQSRILREGLPGEVQAFPMLSGRWLPKAPEVSALEPLLAQALVGHRVARGRRNKAGRPFLISVFPCTLDPGVCFLTATDLSPVLERLRRLHLLFLAAAAFTVILAGFLARVISRTLLEPVQKLADGVTAFENGRRNLALPNLGQDEIGVLGEAFNAMVREAREVDTARRVQESLIPAHPAELPGYRVALRYLPLEDLAGDYADTILRPDGTLFLAIGDVTGHGIAAALQTAMAKAVCAQSCREGLTLPETFDDLNAIIHQGKESGTYMTFCAGILDPRNHVWHWISAGHNFPLIRRADGSVDFLSHAGVPLGLRQQKSWMVSETILAAGDLVLFYTDGLIEGTNPAQEMFGYDRLTAVLVAARGTPEEIVEQILRAFRAYVADTPLNDDVTLLVLSRDGPVR